MFASARIASAGDIVGLVADATGAVLPAAQVTLRNLATGAEQFAQADLEGRFRFAGLEAGRYLVVIESPGFSRDSRAVTVGADGPPADVRFSLVPGRLEVGVTVTAARSERETSAVPLRTDTMGRDALDAKSPLSVGDALLQAPGVTPVGNGPMQVRPRLRGLDSTRVLVLVDGERLNNARTATDRAGIEVGLIDLNSVASLEVASGAGSVLYGTDALSGTINILTHQPRFSDALRFTYGFDGYFSSNENGRRGSVSLGATGRRFALQVVTGLEAYDNYRAGAAGRNEDTTPFYTSGQITNADTIDDNFGFNFNAFPDPFNAPYARTSAVIPTSGARGNSLNASGVVALTATQTLQVKYIRRQMDNVGFPDFEQPVFFSRDDAAVQQPRPRVGPLRGAGPHAVVHQPEGDRLLPGPAPPAADRVPGAVPGAVARVLPDQRVPPQPRQRHRAARADARAGRPGDLRAGPQAPADGGPDAVHRPEPATRGRARRRARSSATWRWARAARRPTCSATPVVLGPATTTHPVRVPDASFRDIGLFAQDEWSVTGALRLVAGLRVDGYRVIAQATPGYDVLSLTDGARAAHRSRRPAGRQRHRSWRAPR